MAAKDPDQRACFSFLIDDIVNTLKQQSHLNSTWMVKTFSSSENSDIGEVLISCAKAQTYVCEIPHQKSSSL